MLQTDPVAGGSCNAYDYACADPVNKDDTSGNCLAGCIGDLLGIIVAAAVIYIVWRVYCAVKGCTVKIPSSAIRIPFPNYAAWAARAFRYVLYAVYVIYNVFTGAIWKFGITRQVPWTKRVNRQLPKCKRYFGSGCAGSVLKWTIGWGSARTWEARYFAAYVAAHHHCPPGARLCI
ncbi:hypothetical protein Asp14428_32780 [Actinoplanes sp. NBRC 14428]|nr:hypothetical protein Asp14428_32780 [Actinoplanes sp. NBRC 14428]